MAQHSKYIAYHQHAQSDESCAIRLLPFTACTLRLTVHHKDYCSRIFIGQASGKGVGTGMKQSEQKKVLHDFRAGAFNTLVATCIGEEGLDIPQACSLAHHQHFLLLTSVLFWYQAKPRLASNAWHALLPLGVLQQMELSLPSILSRCLAHHFIVLKTVLSNNRPFLLLHSLHSECLHQP